MRFNSIKLVNYIGIYNGMKLNEIFIDFSKCRHKMVIIRGDNGSGKSTIFNALTPLPDNNENFIPGLRAEKEVTIVDNNVLYKINFIHDVKENTKERAVAKGYIYKIVNGQWLNMNPNGNITSFKDILYEEFKLDSNFVALSQLSTEDKGLATKRPAERKKFVNSIIETLEVYNNIYKILTKKSSVLKSMTASITSKLESLGDPNNLKSTLISLENRIVKLDNDKNKCIENIATNKSIIAMTDSDGSIQMRYKQCIDTLEQTKYDLDVQGMSLINICNKLGLNQYKDMPTMKANNQSLKIQTQIDIQKYESKIESMLLERESEAKNLNEKIQRLESLKSDVNYDELVKLIEEYKRKIKYCEEVFNSIGYQSSPKLSKDEYIIGLNTLKEIKEIVDSYRSGVEYEVLREAIACVQEDKYPDISIYESAIENCRRELQEYEKEYNNYEMLQQISTKLSMRPKGCKIDSCEFIKDAISASEEKPEEKLRILDGMIKDVRLNLGKAIEEKEYFTKVVESINNVKTILRAIRSHKAILDKLPEGATYYSEAYLIRRILYNESIDYIDDLYKYIDYANLFDEYSIYQTTLKKLESDYAVYESKSSIIDDINKDVESINNNLNNITRNLQENNEKLLNLKSQLIDYSDKEVMFDSLVSIETEINRLKEKKISIEGDINKFKYDIDKIENAKNNIEAISNMYNSIIQELNPLMKDRDTIKHALSLYEDYVAELEQYKLQYDKVETIKYYSSPTTGIGLVFMDLYMGKVLQMANQLLSLLFESRYVLAPFVITETEFRIPCVSDGLPNDDISSCSSSQVAMMSMVLSYSLLFNSSSKYNILKADEIDAPLDSTNRTQFAYLLDSMMNMLGTEQAILISHNSELNTHESDIVLLKSNNIEEIDGNIIWRYQ